MSCMRQISRIGSQKIYVYAAVPNRLFWANARYRSVGLEPILRDVIQSSIDLLPKADREYVRSHMIGFKLQPKAMNRLGIKDT